MPTITEISENVLRLSNELESLGDQQEAAAERIYELKRRLDKHTEEKHAEIRMLEDGGKVLYIGKEIKLTDAVRESIARADVLDDYAEYEALKRKSDRIREAVSAKSNALSGWQTLAGIEKKILETLEFQT